MFAKEGSKDETPKEETPKVVNPARVDYIARGIAKLKLGRFQFENGRLSLSPEDAAQFDKLLAGASIRTRQTVQKIDTAAGEKIAQEFVKQNQGTMIRGGDTTDNTVNAPNPGEQK